MDMIVLTLVVLIVTCAVICYWIDDRTPPTGQAVSCDEVDILTVMLAISILNDNNNYGYES